MNNHDQTNGSKSFSFGDLAHSIHTVSHYSQNPLAQEAAFIGREQELATIEQYFRDPSCHMLTLTGIGGIGKTRLAWEAGSRIAHRFVNGSCFIPLAPIASPSLIVPSLASSLGYFFHGSESPQIQLLNFLRHREMLLVLDNFEHLMAGINLIPEIITAAPGIRLLVTSRERLNLREEWILDISGLDYPNAEIDRDIEAYSAVRLFLQNAHRVKADFRLTGVNQPDVIRICRLVEGMPLGIELAAAWLRALSCRAIADEIERNFDFLTSSLRNVSEKHRSMRAVFAHSYALLTPEQQQVFNKLSVFRGGFMRAAAETVATASLMTLTALIDKSLLRIDGDDRYDMHELLRQYAEEQLNTLGVGDAIRDAHTAYYAEFVNLRVDDLKGRRQPEALNEIHDDFENIQTAWNRAAYRKQAQLVDRMIEGLSLFCAIRNRDAQALTLFRYAEQQFSGDRRRDVVRLWGRLLARAAEGEDFQPYLEKDLQIARRYDDRAEIAFCLEMLSWAAFKNDDYEKAKQLVEQSIAYYRDLGDQFYLASALNTLHRSDPERDWESYKKITAESLRIRRAINDKAGIAAAVIYAALDSIRVGKFREAEHYWYERITLGQEVGSLGLFALGYAHLSYSVYFILGDFDEARSAAEQAIRIGTAIGFEDPVGWSSTTLSLLASMEENYRDGKSYGERAAASEFIWIKTLADWGLAVAHCGLGDYRAAREHLLTTAKYLMTFYGLPGTVAIIGIGAVLLAQAGENTRAVEWLALAFTHPVRAAGWMEKWMLLARLRASLEQILGSQAYADAWERGKLLDAETAAAELQQWLQAIQPALQDETDYTLTESLTARERDVLRLLAAGLSNQAIAEQLIISVGTVKAHTSSIYGKLGVNNRVQAINLASKLALL